MVQIILILDFLFVINDYLIDRDSCKAVLVVGSAILYLGSFAMSGLAYYYYGREVRCSRNIAFITCTMIAGIFCTALSVSAPSKSPMSDRGHEKNIHARSSKGYCDTQTGLF